MMMKLLLNGLPKTQSRLLQGTIAVLAAIWVGMGANFILAGIWERTFVQFLVGLCIGMIPIAVGVSLWRLSRYACSITKFMIGALMVMSIVLMVGPCLEKACSYQDFLRFDSLKPYLYLLFIASAFFSFGVLDRYKAEFRSPTK